ncbi:MAG: GNAT family N-acetyltransferase [Thermoguttaceae bacterium]
MSRSRSLRSAPLGRQVDGKRGNRSSPTLAVVPARPGDYQATLRFLTSVFRGPSPAEFRATIEDPCHELADRMVVRRGHEILGHALITHRAIRLGGRVVPAAGLQGLAVSPDLRGLGLGALLLRRAERRMIDEGHVLGFLAAADPAFFERFGWTACGRRNQYSFSACKVLSVLASKGLYPSIRKPLDIRPMRRMEIAQVAEVYRVGASDQHGPIHRSEAYWQWLVNRRAYDAWLVALDRPGGRGAARGDAVVGYAVLAGDRVVELFTLPDERKAAVQLLARACGEAIERGFETLRMDVAPEHPLTRLLEAADGRRLAGNRCRDDVLMAKALRPEEILRKLGGLLRDRAIAADLPLPLDLGLAFGGQKCRISMGTDVAGAGTGLPAAAGAVEVTGGSVGRSYLRTSVSRLTELLLGQVDWDSPVGIEFSTRLAQQAATALFPRQSLWRPLLDDLPAGGR